MPHKILTKIVKMFCLWEIWTYIYQMCDKSNKGEKTQGKQDREEERQNYLGRRPWSGIACKFFNSSTFYRQYGSFIKGASNVAKKEDEKKTKSKR